MRRFILTGLLVALSTMFIGCHPSDNEGGEFESNATQIEVDSTFVEPVYSDEKLPYKGANFSKNANGVYAINFSKSLNKGLSLTEEIELTNSIYSWTKDTYVVFDKTVGKTLISGDRIPGHEYIYSVDCYLDSILTLKGELSIIMEKGLNYIEIPTNLVANPKFKIKMDLNDKVIEEIIDSKFIDNKNGTITFETELGATEYIVVKDYITVEWTLTPDKIIKHLQNAENYKLEEVIQDPGAGVNLVQLKLSEQKSFSETYNKNMEEKYYSFSILIDIEGYELNFEGNAYIYLKNKNGVYKDIYTPLEKGDIIDVSYYNDEYLDFSLTFEEIEKEEVEETEREEPKK